MNESSGLIVADVGGTHTRIAAVATGRDLRQVEAFANDAHDGIAAILKTFGEAHFLEFERAALALALACPIEGDTACLTNRGWVISRPALRREFGFRTVELVNDFEAIALSLPHLTDDDLEVLAPGTPDPQGPRVVLGPGTGLGVAVSVFGRGGWTAVRGEGGHATLSACSDEEDAIVRILRARYGHLSAERVLSGPGIAALYDAVRTIDGAASRSLAPEAITTAARDGGDRHAATALSLFFKFLGGFAGNLALTCGATGGVYLAGGILSDVKDLLARSAFNDAFMAKGRFVDFLGKVRRVRITHAAPALAGLAHRYGN